MAIGDSTHQQYCGRQGGQKFAGKSRKRISLRLSIFFLSLLFYQKYIRGTIFPYFLENQTKANIVMPFFSLKFPFLRNLSKSRTNKNREKNIVTLKTLKNIFIGYFDALGFKFMSLIFKVLNFHP